MTGSSAASWAEYVQKLGLALQQARANAGLTQDQVAAGAGMSRSHYQYLEHGESRPGVPSNPSLRALTSLATVLGVRLEALVPHDLPEI